MKYNNNKLLLFSLLLLMLGSCKKVINTTETDLISGETALKTVSYNEQAILGAYAATGIEMAILLNATFADEVKVAEFYNAGTTHEWQYGSTDVGLRDNYTATTPNYRVIDRVNRVLEALPGADSTKAGDNALRLRLRGEALFLRAFSHFELYRFYCANYDPNGLAMPYMETPSIEPQARIKMDAYFGKMSADVAEAKQLLPNNLTDINRATRLAATALQARIALYKKEWAAAETFSTEVISGLPLASMANFPGIWTDANTSEVAFRLVRTSSFGGRIGSLWRGTSASAANIGTVTWRPSDEIWGAYDQANDVRFASYFKDEPLLAPARGTRLIYKYAGTTYGTPNENVANAKVYRTGEMYLIRAEARAEQNKITGANSAESDINELRAARITGYVDVVFASKAEAIDAVLLERYKELAYEGHRFWDLKRRGLPVERLATDAPTTNAAVLSAGNFRFLLPIPDPEMKANTLMVQNPGYN
ncbi:MAG TPA: RagB/SusD family nutrient uptake outer membrane protein [Chitinophagaceae bacterium]|nr:RagB/SusD family nutrient uptake outer membrane protein [Chitinophagaceae bacterium]